MHSTSEDLLNRVRWAFYRILDQRTIPPRRPADSRSHAPTRYPEPWATLSVLGWPLTTSIPDPLEAVSQPSDGEEYLKYLDTSPAVKKPRAFVQLVDWSSVPLPAAPATHGTDLDGDTGELGQTPDGIDYGEAGADGETVDGYIDDIDAGDADAEGEPDPEYVQGSDIDDNGKRFENGGSRESEMGGSDGDSGDSGDSGDNGDPGDNGDTGDNGDSGDDGGDGGCGYDSGDNGTIDWNTVTNDDTNQYFNPPPLPPSEMDPPSADVARSPDPEFDRIWDLTTNDSEPTAPSSPISHSLKRPLPSESSSPPAKRFRHHKEPIIDREDDSDGEQSETGSLRELIW